MSSYEKFWLSFWAMVILGVVVLFGMGFYFDERAEQKVVEMVKTGANPIQARCSLLSTGTTDPMCMAFIGSGK